MLFKKTAIAIAILCGANHAVYAQSEDPKSKLPTQQQICALIIQNYAKAALGSPTIARSQNQMHDDMVRLSATLARHSTLERLLTLGWSMQCDLSPILQIETKRIDSTYQQLGVN